MKLNKMVFTKPVILNCLNNSIKIDEANVHSFVNRKYLVNVNLKI